MSTTESSTTGPKDYHLVPQKPTSVQCIGFKDDPNLRYRKNMEDGHVMLDAFRQHKTDGFFAIYDGHGGRKAVDYVEQTLHKHFQLALENNKSVKEAFIYSYKQTDDELGKKDIQYNGTTAITCFIRTEDKAVRKLYTANCGDARVVINRGGTARRLTYDHKASDKKEAKRITDNGGFVAYERVNGILSVTRALGDHAMKQWVVCDPYYTELELHKTDKFIIMACDGVWDVLSDQEAVDLVKTDTDAQAMADKIVKTALEKGSTDNVTCIVLVFRN